MEETDLQASLPSPLLASGLTDFLSSLLTDQGKEDLAASQINWSSISVVNQQLHLQGNLTDSQGKIIQLEITAGLTLANSHTLALCPLVIKTTPELLFKQLHRLEIDLGQSVAIAELALEAGKLLCSGKITVLP